VYEYKKGGSFGELALLNDMPRQANIVAIGDCKCAFLDRAAFTRLLGTFHLYHQQCSMFTPSINNLLALRSHAFLVFLLKF
jgi:CRP-like cAMP-binding protein